MTFVPPLSQAATPSHQHSTAAPNSDTAESHDVASSVPSSADNGSMSSHSSNSVVADSPDLQDGHRQAGSDSHAHGEGVIGSQVHDGADAGLASTQRLNGLLEDTDGSSSSSSRTSQNSGSNSRFNTEGVSHASKDEPTRSQLLVTSSDTEENVSVITAAGRTQEASRDEVAALTSELRALRMDHSLMLCQLEAAQGQFVAKEQAMEVGG